LSKLKPQLAAETVKRIRTEKRDSKQFINASLNMIIWPGQGSATFLDKRDILLHLPA